MSIVEIAANRTLPQLDATAQQPVTTSSGSAAMTSFGLDTSKIWRFEAAGGDVYVGGGPDDSYTILVPGGTLSGKSVPGILIANGQSEEFFPVGNYLYFLGSASCMLNISEVSQL